MIAELVAGVVLGCGGTPMDRQIPVSRGRQVVRTIDTLGLQTMVPLGQADAWKALPAVYGELGLEVNFQEPAGQRLGTCYQRVRLRLGGRRLSTLVDCGDQRGLPNADRYEVGLTVLTTLMPSTDNTTTLYIFVLGVGLDASGAAAERVWCYSKGVIEEEIRAGLERLGRA
ncbi:MAG: hypothetical protein ACYC2K_01170 [Gemmatimonadales bacterium]